MDISYVHTCKRKDLGQPCHFTDVGPNLQVSIDPDPELKAQFYAAKTIDKEVDNTVKICAQEVNTVSNKTESRGMNHKEGGWASEIDTEDEDSKAKFRKQTEKNEGYTNAIANLGKLVENLVMENNSIDVYEEYFADERVKLRHETTFKTISVVCDPNETPRKVMNLSWSLDSSKVAGAYSIDGIRGKLYKIGIDSYVWDTGNNSNPYCVLKSESCLNCVEFSPTEINLLLGGYVSGQVALWDIRIGGHAQKLSDVKESHTQRVTGMKWLKTNSRMDFFSVSTDGIIMSWDARRLTEPTQKIYLTPEKSSIPNLDNNYSGTCAGYNKCRPDNFILGTQQGHILSFSRKCSSESDIQFSRYDCLCGSVLSIGSNPFFPHLFATCDPSATKIWVEKNTESPVLNLISQDGYCTDFVWSPTRATALYVAKTTGFIELWDVLGQHFKPRTCIRFDKDALYSVSADKSGQLLACGSGSGKIHLMMVPDQYKNSSNIELDLIATSVGSKRELLEESELKDSFTVEGMNNEQEKEKYQAPEKLFKTNIPDAK